MPGPRLTCAALQTGGPAGRGFPCFEDGHELFLVLLESAQHGIGDFSVHLDVPFAGKGEGIPQSGRTGVAEEAAKNVGQEIGEESSFLEIVGAARSDEPRPVLELGLPISDAIRQIEGARTCWRMTSGWKSGLDSRAIWLAEAHFQFGSELCELVEGPFL